MHCTHQPKLRYPKTELFSSLLGNRSVGASGGYTVYVEYKVEIERGIPDWARDAGPGGGGGGFFSGASLPCFELTAPGDGPEYDPLGLFPYGDFPFCAPMDIDWARIELPHPINAALVGELRPIEMFTMPWADIDRGLDAVFTYDSDLSIRLFDGNRKVVGEAVPLSASPRWKSAYETAFGMEDIGPDATGEGRNQSRLSIPSLVDGFYFLQISGPKQAYSVDFRMPRVQVALPVTKPLPWWPWLFWLLLIMAIVAFLVMKARKPAPGP